MSKRNAIVLTALFCAWLGGVALASLLLPDRAVSELENRALRQRPELRLSAVLDGRFMSQAEDYVSDQLVGRDLWVATQAWCERLSGKRENNGVYFGEEDTLLKRLDEPDEDKLARDVAYVGAFARSVDVPVFFGLIPSSSAIWSERLPHGAPSADERGLIERLYARAEVETLDLYGVLAAHADEPIYYRTDHHWTSLGAYYGCAALTEALGLDPIAPGELAPATVSRTFYGTNYSLSGARWIAPDSIETYVSGDGLTVESTASEGENALYAERWLDRKDKYSYFLGGQQPLCVVRTGLADAPKLLLVRDSYADSLAPFLTLRCSELHLWDLRYNTESLTAYIAEHDFDGVVILYAITGLTDGPSLSLLTQ